MEFLKMKIIIFEINNILDIIDSRLEIEEEKM